MLLRFLKSGFDLFLILLGDKEKENYLKREVSFGKVEIEAFVYFNEMFGRLIESLHFIIFRIAIIGREDVFAFQNIAKSSFAVRDIFEKRISLNLGVCTHI